MNLLHTGMDQKEETNHTNLYRPGTHYDIQTEVTNCYTCQRTKQSTGQLVFDQYTILPIRHIAYCKYTHERKKSPIEKDATSKNKIEYIMIKSLDIKYCL